MHRHIDDRCEHKQDRHEPVEPVNTHVRLLVSVQPRRVARRSAAPHDHVVTERRPPVEPTSFPFDSRRNAARTCVALTLHRHRFPSWHPFDRYQQQPAADRNTCNDHHVSNHLRSLLSDADTRHVVTVPTVRTSCTCDPPQYVSLRRGDRLAAAVSTRVLRRQVSLSLSDSRHFLHNCAPVFTGL